MLSAIPHLRDYHVAFVASHSYTFRSLFVIAIPVADEPLIPHWRDDLPDSLQFSFTSISNIC
jgi:hypothetical protein